jgi:hypothetical protein
MKTRRDNMVTRLTDERVTAWLKVRVAIERDGDRLASWL